MIIPESAISSINAICIILLITFLIIGFLNGAVKQIFNLLSNIIALIIAFLLRNVLPLLFPILKSDVLSFDFGPFNEIIIRKINSIIWFIIIFFSVKIILFLLRPIFVKIFDLPVLKEFNRLLGVFISLISYCLFIFMICYFLSLPIFTNGQEIIKKTYLKPINQMTQVVFDKINNSVINKIDISDIDLDKMEISEETFNSIIDSLNISQESVENVFEKFDLSIEKISKYLQENQISLRELLEIFNFNDLNEIIK